MIIKDLFKKPIDRSIQGVVTIGNEDEEQKWQELEEYVCTEEIIKQFRIFFRKYRESINNPTEKMAAWITGFFGSGKSHFLKILGYILENEEVAGIRAVEYFNDKIKDEMLLADIKKCASANNKIVLFNIDSKAKSDSKNKTQAIMDIMLRAFNESIGYCGDRPWVADLERMLDEEGLLNDFVTKFEKLSGRDWKANRSKAALNKKNIIDALVEVRKVPRTDAEDYINDQINNYTNSTEDFAMIVNEYCQKNKTRIVFLMDEVGQFIGDNTQLMLNLQTCVEDLGKYCKGQAWVVVTSQQELKAMIDSTNDKRQDFSKIQARFDTRILLSGAEAGEVIKKRILDKKDNAVDPLKSLYDSNANKISNLIIFAGSPTWKVYKDAEDFKNVYPFVPYQFELLQKVFTAIREHGMSEGKHLAHSERSLLSAFQESAKKYSDAGTNILIPFDSFYSTIEQFIDWDVKNVFTSAENKTTISDFDLRVLKILFMILHVKEMPATIDRIATLMVESLNEDKVLLKNKIADSLKVLEKETLIQKNGDEFDFLTNEEQDVNKQINHVDYNEGEVKRNILDIVYDKVLELTTKFRYKNRYDFSLNRYVDDELKGSHGQDNISIKIMTNFSGISDPTMFASESTRSNALVVDLTEGNFIEELTRANKISLYKRNNSSSLSVSMTEIMAKKSAELSERVKRAEEIIKESLRSAPIYFNGNIIDIKQKDGKDRLNDALNQVVEQEYYKLGYVSYFYQDQKSILEVLNSNNNGLFGNDIAGDANEKAFQEIFDKIKNDKNIAKRTNVKELLDHFSKKPFGWRDLDVLGMIAKLFKLELLQIFIHDVLVDDKNYSFKNDFVKKNSLDTMVVRVQEKIDESVLIQVKQIMNKIYSLSLQINESEMKKEVLNFFTKKRDFLRNLKIKYGNEFAGASCVPSISKDIEEIVRTNDSATIFNEIILRKDSLEEKSEILEQLESFYKEGSNQQKVYNDALEIVKWYYQNNNLLNALNKLDNVISSIDEILKMDVPFTKINQLSDLVFKAGEVKEQILEEKYNEVINSLKDDQKNIKNEFDGVTSSDLSESKKNKIKDKYEEIDNMYQSWYNTLSNKTQNLDSYVVSSQNTVKDFKKFISSVMVEVESIPNVDNPNQPVKEIKRKNVRVIDCVPIAKKKIKSKDDIDSVIESIRKALEEALQNNDEITID